MPGHKRPFRRTCRPDANGNYFTQNYIKHRKYAADAHLYIRAFMLIQKDLLNIFDYIEPSEDNKYCYPHRIHEILLRACVEVEANFKAILAENGYPVQRKKDKDVWWGMKDYRKVEKTHRLSEYEIHYPLWRSNLSTEHFILQPFKGWANPSDEPEWYRAYNATKHDRHRSFKSATLLNAVSAVAGLFALLTAQF